MNFYTTYLILCNSIAKTPSRVAIECGISKTSVNRWKKGSLPTDANLLVLADYFGVSVDYLLGNTEIKTPATKKGDGLTDAQRELIQLIPTLTVQEILVLASTAKSLIDARKFQDEP